MDNICIGTAQMGMPYGIANQTGMPDAEEVQQIITLASAHGIFFYDTAAAYGRSESVLGNAFAQAGIQADVCVVTKLGPEFFFSDYGALKEEIRQSTARLQVPFLWGLLMHRTTVQGDWKKFCLAVERLKTEGMIKHFGVSVYRPEEALRFARTPEIDVIQVPFNILDRRLLDNHFFEIAEEMNKTVFIRSVFLQGLVLMTEKEIADKHMAWALPFLADVRRFAARCRLDIKTLALTAVCRTIPRARVIIGIDSCQQLTQNIDLVCSSSPESETIADWWKILPRYPEKLVNPSLW